MIQNQDEFSEDQVSYQRKGNNSYLAVKSSGNEMISYEINMIRYNKLQGILPVQFWIEDGSYHYFYDISGKLSLCERMKEKKYGLQEIRAIMNGLYSCVQEMEEYLLDLNALILKPDYIYTEQQNFKPFFCFYPDKQEAFGTSLEKLFEYLLNRLDYQDEKTVILVYSLYQKSREHNVPLSELMKVFYETDEHKTESTELLQEKQEYESLSEADAKDSCINKKIPDEMKAGIQNKKGMRLIPYLPDAAGGLVIAFIIWRITRIRNQLSMTDFCLWGLCIAGILFGCSFASAVLSKLMDENTDHMPEEKEGKPNRSRQAEQNFEKKHEKQCEKMYESRAENQRLNYEKQDVYASEAVVKKEEDRYEELDFYEEEINIVDKAEEKLPEKRPIPATVIMSPDELFGFLPAVLKSCGQKDFADVVLQERDMLIGKMQGISQICIDSKAVSRMHARIMQGKDGWELIDLGSTNGTYVNGERLEEGFHCILKSEDEVRFADVQYRFEML